MAIFHCDISIHSRSGGRSATAAAAYRAAEKIADERTGQTHDYTHKQGVQHAEIITPEYAPDWMRDRARLWNAVEAAEKRKDAQLLREVVVALPHELDATQRLDLVRGFIRDQFTSQGMIADFAIHAPSKAGDERNHHAHILLTLREVTPEGFGNKERAWNAKVNIYQWRQAWERHANQALEQAGLDCRIDGRSLADKGLDQEPRVHLGVHASAIERNGGQSDRGNENRAIETRNDTRAQLRRELNETNGEIDKLLQEITQTRAVFDERDLARTLFKHDIDTDARYRLLADNQVLHLQGDNGQTLYTTVAMRDSEQAALDAALRNQEQDQDQHSPACAPARLEQTLRRYQEAGKPLDAEQEQAVRHALANRIAVIQGRAGTGKSFTLNALRETLEAEGYQVTGLAPTNTAAKDLREAGFADARTLHSFLYSHRKALEAGRPLPNTPRVFIVDEAAMVDTQRTLELLQAAEQLNARVVFAGDERQLESIEAGGMFGVFAKEFGETELSTVHRQREDWQRDATRAFARGDTAEGMQAYAAHGAIDWSQRRDEAAAQLVQDWVAARDSGQNNSAFVFAHSNASVNSLNTALQAEQVKAGLVKNRQLFTTERGQLWVGEGDRLQCRANDKPNGVYNGSLGTVEKIKGDTIAVRLDSGSAYTIDVKAYKDFQLGYAGTIYRGQGKTIDQAFVLYSPGMDKKTAYVAMTRAREQTRVYVAREDAPDLQTVVKNIDSRKHYGASLNYAIKPENQNQPQQARPQPQKEPSQQEQEQARLERARLNTERLREQRLQRERERGLDRER